MRGANEWWREPTAAAEEEEEVEAKERKKHIELKSFIFLSFWMWTVGKSEQARNIFIFTMGNEIDDDGDDDEEEEEVEYVCVRVSMFARTIFFYCDGSTR